MVMMLPRLSLCLSLGIRLSGQLLHLSLAVSFFVGVSSTAFAQHPSEQASPVLPTQFVVATIKQITVLGSTVFSAADFEAVTAAWLGKETNLVTLQSLSAALTNLYVEAGYVTSGAYLPPQDLSDGTVVVQVVEGQLEKIEIQGLSRLIDSYVRERLLLAAESPLNIRRLEEALQLLQFSPLFERIRAELKQGTAPELSVLVVEVEEAPALGVGLQFDNYESPSIGSGKGTVAIEHQNLLGVGDRLSGSIGITEGLERYEIRYTVPFNARDGTFKLEFYNSDSEIVEQFENLGLRAESRTFSVGWHQPILENPAEELALFLSLDWRESKTFILEDIPFSFTVGPESGKSRVTALRFGQEWISRSSERVLAARSQFSFGLDLFDPTINDLGIDGRFFSWQGQFQLLEKLDEDIFVFVRLATQLSPDSLLPIEQFEIGGINTLRGYRRNFRIGDNGLNASAELRLTVFEEPDWGKLSLAPFVDFGTVWNNRTDVLTPNTLVSTGLALGWQNDNFSARLDWGIPLTDIENQGDSLQEKGISFSLSGRWRF